MILNKSAAMPPMEIQRKHQTAILRLWESYALVTDVPAQLLILFAIERLLAR
jgi:hypothetical protein